MASKLPRAFYDRPTLDVAADLIGKVLVHNRRGIRTSGVIVEAEAYIGESDPACHAAPGRTRRNVPLYGPPGHAYVYLNYGIHCLVNVVTEAEGSPAAVLIRALEPLDGVDVMRRRRARAMKGRAVAADRDRANHDLCRGPGNLTMAMGISLSENQLDLLGDRLFLEDRAGPRMRVAWGPRIGIRVGTGQPWRVYVAGNPAVSGHHAFVRNFRLQPDPVGGSACRLLALRYGEPRRSEATAGRRTLRTRSVPGRRIQLAWPAGVTG